MSNDAERKSRGLDALESHEILDAAMLEVGRRAFQYAAWTNTLLWVWQDGKVVGIDPNDPDAQLPEGFVRPPPGPPPWIGL